MILDCEIYASDSHSDLGRAEDSESSNVFRYATLVSIAFR